jgi:quercetin dioxygenase-like cupin family protein
MIGALAPGKVKAEMSTKAIHSIDHKNFSRADEVRAFERGRVELCDIGGRQISRFTLDPGWQWSKHVKPIANTEWCMIPHSQYVISGRLRVRMKDGKEFEVGPGDLVYLPEGHDGWVVGNEPAIMLDWGGGDYAKRQ